MYALAQGVVYSSLTAATVEKGAIALLMVGLALVDPYDTKHCLIFHTVVISRFTDLFLLHRSKTPVWTYEVHCWPYWAPVFTVVTPPNN